ERNANSVALGFVNQTVELCLCTRCLKADQPTSRPADCARSDCWHDRGFGNAYGHAAHLYRGNPDGDVFFGLSARAIASAVLCTGQRAPARSERAVEALCTRAECRANNRAKILGLAFSGRPAERQCGGGIKLRHAGDRSAAVKWRPA